MCANHLFGQRSVCVCEHFKAAFSRTFYLIIPQSNDALNIVMDPNLLRHLGMLLRQRLSFWPAILNEPKRNDSSGCRAYLKPVIGRNEIGVTADGLEDMLLPVDDNPLTIRPVWCYIRHIMVVIGGD